MFCNKCGNQMPEGTAFCAVCGTRMDQQQTAAQPAFTSAPQQPAPAPRQAAPANRRKGNNEKDKMLVLITMGVSLLLIVFSVISTLNMAVYKIPAISLALTISGERDEVIGGLLGELDYTIEELDDELDYREDYMDDDELELAKKALKSMEKLYKNCSIANVRGLVNLMEDINEDLDVGISEDEFDEVNLILNIVVAVVIAFFVLPVVFTLLGGLNRNVPLTIIGMVFTTISQLICCSLLWVILSLAVGIFQVKLCNDLKKRRRAPARMPA